MKKILILGAGVMGSAFSFPPADLGHIVSLVGTPLDHSVILKLKESKKHPRLKMTLPERVRFFFHEELEQAFEDAPDIIVLGVSSAGIDWAIQALGSVLKQPTPILMLTKGLSVSGDTLEILPNKVAMGLRKYGYEGITIGAVGGPCIAGELAARRDTRVTIAWPNATEFSWLDSLFRATYYHINYSNDLTGLEVCAALKNFYAISVGSPAGIQESTEKPQNEALMHNLSAGLFTQSITEMARFVGWMGGSLEHVYGLAGTGDLYVTCQAGRNSRMGYWLGTGLTYSVAKQEKMTDETVEGAEVALVIGPLLERLFQSGVLPKENYPLARAIKDAVCENEQLTIPWDQLN